jgi:hypothetical protein
MEGGHKIGHKLLAASPEKPLIPVTGGERIYQYLFVGPIIPSALYNGRITLAGGLRE